MVYRKVLQKIIIAVLVVSLFCTAGFCMESSAATNGLKAPKVTISQTGKGHLKITTNINKKAAGYQIVLAKNSKFKKAKKILVTGNKVKAQKTGKLTLGAKYYVKVRAYKLVKGKKVFGAFSKKKAASIYLTAMWQILI